MLRPETARRPWTVSELALEIRTQLRPLATVFVKGEVSGMKRSARGNYSFTIKEGQLAAVEAMIWGDTARRLPLLPEDGQEFVFRGRVDFWPQGARLRLVVDYLEFDDVGKMRARLEQLKQSLELEGAFDPARKRRLPFLPRRVGLVTSPTGAVIHDLQETIWDRFPNMEIIVYPAQVQGTASPGSVAGALRRCNRDALADVVVIARGGGSFEELYAFNTEPVARAILASRVPVTPPIARSRTWWRTRIAARRPRLVRGSCRGSRSWPHSSPSAGGGLTESSTAASSRPVPRCPRGQSVSRRLSPRSSAAAATVSSAFGASSAGCARPTSSSSAPRCSPSAGAGWNRFARRLSSAGRARSNGGAPPRPSIAPSPGLSTPPRDY
jgi:hypothetical protein